MLKEKIAATLNKCGSLQEMIDLLTSATGTLSEVKNANKKITVDVDYVKGLEDTIATLKAQIEQLQKEAQNGKANGTTNDLRDDEGRAGNGEPVGYGQGQDGQTTVSDVTGAGLRGKTVKLKIPKHPDLDTQYEIVELATVKASHIPSEDFRVNREYGLENERQYQTEKGSQEKVLRNAANLDPDYLVNQSIDANQGAPVVDYLGNVLGGNSRTMSIGIVYAKYPEKAEAYKQALIDRASDFGMSAAEISKMQQPILIRRVAQEMSKNERQGLVSALNEDFKATRERKAEGKSRGMRIKKTTITTMARRMRESDASSLRDFFDKDSSLDVIQMFIQDGVISETESNSFIAADGKLNPEGKRVIEESLRGRMVEKYETLSNLKATTLERVDRALPDLLFLEAVGNGWSITKQVQRALSLTSQYSAGNFDGTGTFLNQTNMLTGKTPRETVSKKTCIIFERLINDGKDKTFAKRVGKMAVDSNLSEGALPGLAKTPPESFQAAFEPDEAKL